MSDIEMKQMFDIINSISNNKLELESDSDEEIIE